MAKQRKQQKVSNLNALYEQFLAQEKEEISPLIERQEEVIQEVPKTSFDKSLKYIAKKGEFKHIDHFSFHCSILLKSGLDQERVDFTCQSELEAWAKENGYTLAKNMAEAHKIAGLPYEKDPVGKAEALQRAAVAEAAFDSAMSSRGGWMGRDSAW